MTIAVTGATGQLGQLVMASLKAHGARDTIALVRTPAKAKHLGVEARAFDYTKPETMAEALQGVDKLLLISSSEIGQRTAQHRNVIDAAKAAGVKLIAYTSVLHADTSELGLAAEHRETEAMLKASGIPYVLLRNGWYTENYLASVPGALGAGAFIGSAGDGKIASAARADYAEAAAVVLTTEGHAGKTYELAGDAAYTLSDLAAEVSRASGKPLPYVNMPQAEFAATLAKIGLPTPLAHLLAESDDAASRGALFDGNKALSRLIGRATTPLGVMVAGVVKA